VAVHSVMLHIGTQELRSAEHLVKMALPTGSSSVGINEPLFAAFVVLSLLAVRVRGPLFLFPSMT
jgi:tRNA(Phe) wybutosine-synthesizing methylase Tyw3